jgi:GTP-binding protein HflX
MIEIKKRYFENRKERCVLVGLAHKNLTKWEVEDHLNELAALAKTANAIVDEVFVQERYTPDSAFFIGKGKIEEIAEFVENNKIDLVIFDDELSPAQIKNIENVIKCKIIDRAALILDIFANHARSYEAKVQVELAQLNYLLPRLTRIWTHLSRQVGGIGAKGPGETQLETDRRLVRTRIAALKKRLEKISRHVETQKKQRGKNYRAALIGYTNAGKSTLLNSLTNENILAQDKLFATLDTTVRKLQLNDNTEILLSDTVGFIRKLPHHLVASFRTTLSEAMDADLLINVIDISHPHFEEHLTVVNGILDDMKINNKDRQLVFNKVDALKEQSSLAAVKAKYPDAIFISAGRKIGLLGLKKAIQEKSQRDFNMVQLNIPYTEGQIHHRLRQLGSVIQTTSNENFIHVLFKYARDKENQFKKIAAQFIV